MEQLMDGLAIGSGRLLPSAAAFVGLIGVIVGGIALSRIRSNGRSLAKAAMASGLLSLFVGGLHAANSAGGFGTGNGLAGAIAAIVLGTLGITLGGLAVRRRA